MQPAPERYFWAGRAVAVTGATGFVGHHLALRLRALGADVTVLVRAGSRRERLLAAGVCCAEAPLDDPGALADACRGREFLFHVAGSVGFGDNRAALRRVIVEGTRNALAAARFAGVRRVVYTSSIVAVGATDRPEPQDESSPWTLGRLRVPYVTTKREAEELALSAAGPGLEVVAVNPASMIGPDDFDGGEFGTLCGGFWSDRAPFHFGGGNNFVDVRDVAAGHLLAARRGRSGERYLITGHNLTYVAFFAELARAAGRRIFRPRLANAAAPRVAAIEERLGRPDARPYLTRARAKLLPLFFYFDGGKAERELHYRPRPLAETLTDAHAFWAARRAA
jgi:dihydroflavonol-4-reductase